MTEINWERLNELTIGIAEESPDIEGVIYKNEQGEWVTFVMTMDGKILRLRTDYCMFCGLRIDGLGTHQC